MDSDDFDDGGLLLPGFMMADSEISELDLAPERSRAPARNSSNARSTAARHPDSGDRKQRRRTATKAPKELLLSSPVPRKQSRTLALPPSLPPPEQSLPSATMEEGPPSANHDSDYDSWEEDDMAIEGIIAASSCRRHTPPPSYRSSSSSRQRQRQHQHHRHHSRSRTRNQNQNQNPHYQQGTMTTEERLAQIARLCVAASGRLVTVAKENRHLAVEAGARLDAYVLRPCLRAGAGLARTYCPEGVRALRDAEAQVRRAVGVVGARGRGSRSSSGGCGAPGLSEKEFLRLKDRLVEQDCQLRDWHSQIRRLLRERDTLRRRLSSSSSSGQRQGRDRDRGADYSPTGGGGATAAAGMGLREYLEQQGSGSQTPQQQFRTPCPSVGGDEEQAGDGEDTRSANTTTAATRQQQKQQQQQLVEQLRQLQMLVDQLAVHEVLNDDDGDYDYDYDYDRDHDGEGHTGRDRRKLPQLGTDDDPEDEDWTLL